ncbi:MAG: hypothetical protein R6X34_10860, partial [Chloroflexota bacterium]
MQEDLLWFLIASILGGFIGSIISMIVPRLYLNPRIKIEGLTPQANLWHIVVDNRGPVAATHVMGRLTLRSIREEDIIGTIQEVMEARKHKMDNDWKRNINSYLRVEEWELGIEEEYIFFLTAVSKESPYITTINPGMPERLAIAYSDGPWVDIPSEHIHRKRARLKLDEERVYYGEVVVGAENGRRSKPLLQILYYLLIAVCFLLHRHSFTRQPFCQASAIASTSGGAHRIIFYIDRRIQITIHAVAARTV